MSFRLQKIYIYICILERNDILILFKEFQIKLLDIFNPNDEQCFAI